MTSVSTNRANDVSMAHAREWEAQLERWIETRGLRGYDRFDVRGHRLLRGFQSNAVFRKAASGVVEFFPHLSRRLLRIEPQLNAKAFALVALGYLRRYQVTGEPTALESAEQHLQWLLKHPSPSYSELCWGYPFDVLAKGLSTSRNTPVVVVSAIAGEAFALAYRITGDGAYLEALRSIASFIQLRIPQLTQPDGTVCFAYTPTDRRRVHNANLHAAAHLLRVFRLTQEAQFKEVAWPAVEFTLRRQYVDGSWPYGEHEPGEPFEAKLLAQVDHHHTGFVLRSLYEIHEAVPSEELKAQILRGFAFYRDRLFESDGCPVTLAGQYPVDIHACAEGMLCPSVLSPWVPEGLDLATRTMWWTSHHMRNPESGVPYYRMYPWFVSKLYCPRWGLAWLFYALCEYLYRLYRAQQRASRADAGGLL